MPAGRPKGSANKRHKSEPRRLSAEVEAILCGATEAEWKLSEASYGQALHPRLAGLLVTIETLRNLAPDSDQIARGATIRVLDSDDLESVTEALSADKDKLRTRTGKDLAQRRLAELGPIGAPLDLTTLWAERLAIAEQKLSRAAEVARAVTDEEFFKQKKKIQSEIAKGERPYVRVLRAYVLTNQRLGRRPTAAEVKASLDVADDDAGPVNSEGWLKVGRPQPPAVTKWTREQVRAAIASLGLDAG